MINIIQQLIQPQIAYATSTLANPWPSTFQSDIFDGMGQVMGLFTTPVMTILTVLGIVFVIVSLIKSLHH